MNLFKYTIIIFLFSFFHHSKLNNQIFLRYIAAVTNTSGQAEIERATNVLLHSNEILEAFGNAKVNPNTKMITNINLSFYP